MFTNIENPYITMNAVQAEQVQTAYAGPFLNTASA